MFRFSSFGIALAAILAASAGPALAAPSFDSLDHNHDGHIKKEQLYGQIKDFSRWDSNDNGMIERDELAQSKYHDAKFDDWDRDGDGEIDSKEFYDGIFSKYDSDKNGRWARREYNDARDAGLFEAHESHADTASSPADTTK
ncbi:hypothetical protein [Salinisphaera sp.]|uniref:hypothetical protein n=1 Tax=Salinisphaera sp. TaxID=1914330 RepID=UPI002D76D31A|nr:hypothetical protein [Salinisphaera sp.]HET7315552.1 hypothetical protein [Salinisphaera sp.]